MASSPKTINVMVGTAGHIDHGKTQLVKLLTGCDTDRLKEEKARGMSIDLGFAPCSLADNANVGIVDVPGHERFIRNMVAGASSIDVVLLVVAGDDGVMPQTREHFEVVQLLGVKRGLVALTKIDIVDQDRRQAALDSIRDLIRGTFLQDAPVVAVSSITGEGFDDFYEALNRVVARTRPRSSEGVFRLPIERVFTVKGYGTVVTGVPASGQVQLHEQLELIRLASHDRSTHSRTACRVRGLQVYGRDADCGFAGQCVAVNIANPGTVPIARGDALVSPGYFEPTHILTGELDLLRRIAKPLPKRTRVAVHVGTSECQGKLVLLDRKELAAGDSCPAQILLDAPVVAGPGDRFVIRTHSPRMTIGGGVVVETTLTGRRKFSDKDLDLFRSRLVSLGDPEPTIVCLARQAGPEGIARSDLQYSSQLKPEKFLPLLDRLLASGTLLSWLDGRMILHPDPLAGLKHRLLVELDNQHAEHPNKTAFVVNELRQLLDISPGPFDLAVRGLISDGQITGDLSAVGLPDTACDLPPDQQTAVTKIEDFYRTSGTTTCKNEELSQLTGIELAQAKSSFDILIERGTLIRITDKFTMHVDVVETAREILVGHLRQHKELVSAQYKDLIDSQRKYAIGLLDYFDRLGISIRRGNSRFLGGKPDATLRNLVAVGKHLRK